MKPNALDLINQIDPTLIDAHIRYEEKLTKTVSRTRFFKIGTIAATVAILFGIMLTVILIGNRPAPYAFMDHDGFYELNKDGKTEHSSKFSSGGHTVISPNTASTEEKGDISEEITIGGTSHRVTSYLSQEGSSLLYALDAPKYDVPFYNEMQRPSVLFDARTGAVTGISHVALDSAPGLGKSAEDYTAFALRAINTYLPYLKSENLKVKNAVSMKEHTSENSLGFILFDYYVKEVRTAMRVSVFFSGGTIFSIGVYDYFDTEELETMDLYYDHAEHQRLLSSFTEYLLGDMTLVKEKYSDGVLTPSVRGGYAISYDLTVQAKDADGTLYKETFTLEIQLG